MKIPLKENTKRILAQNIKYTSLIVVATPDNQTRILAPVFLALANLIPNNNSVIINAIKYIAVDILFTIEKIFVAFIEICDKLG